MTESKTFEKAWEEDVIKSHPLYQDIQSLLNENRELKKKLEEKTSECEAHKKWILLIEQGEATAKPEYEI